MTRTLSRWSASRTSRRMHRFAPLFDRTSDPLGFEAGDANVFRYVGNAPTNATDPSGRIIAELIWLWEETRWLLAGRDGEFWSSLLEILAPGDAVIVIVSGFGRYKERYKTDDKNPSNPLASQIAQELRQRNVQCEGVTPIAVVWGNFERVLARLVQRYSGRRIIWIAFGAGPDRGTFRIEQFGSNARKDSPDIRDQVPGEMGVPELNDPDKLKAYRAPSQLRVGLIRGLLKEQGVKIELSPKGDQYICDSAAFALHEANIAGTIEAGIFFHTPSEMDKGERDEFVKDFVDALFEESGEPKPALLIPKNRR